MKRVYFSQPSTNSGHGNMYYVYVLQNDSDEWYIGYSEDLKRRLAEHTQKQCKSTRMGTWKLLYYEAYVAESDARRRERKLKDRGQAKRQLKERTSASRLGQC